jgi:hypothetical protein
MKFNNQRLIIFLLILLTGILGIRSFVKGGNDKILIEIEWKHHKRKMCLPHEITKDQIIDIGSGFTHVSFAMGNDLHCLVFGRVRIYVIEEWNEHMKGFDIVAIDITNYCGEGRFYIHYPRFLTVTEITGTAFWELIGYYQWEYKKHPKA